MKRIIFLFGFLCITNYLLSQRPGYKISFDQIFDNREYFSEFGFPQTIFGARLNTSLCFDLDSLQGFDAGFNYMYEFGGSLNALPPQLNLYYHYTSKYLDMAFGSFPRRNRVVYPKCFLNDTLYYYRPNIEGAYIAYLNEWLDVSGFIDWTGRVSEERRESFLIGLNSQFSMNNFIIEPSFIMYHNAKSYNPMDTVHLQDNGIMSVLLGYELENNTPLSFRISSGIIASYNRYRPDDFSWGRGIISDIELKYTIFGFKGNYYRGTAILFEYGDPFYRSGNYSRLDFYLDPFRNTKVSSKVGWSLHYIPGEGIHNSQQVLISVKF